MMEVRLMIQEEDTDPARLANTVTQKTNQVLAKIKKNGDFNATLTDRNSYQTNRQNPGNNKKTDYFWQEQATISIKSKNFVELNKLVASVQNVARLQGVTFSVSKEKLKSVEEGLTKEAIEQFRKRATMISKALGSTGGAMPVSYRNNSMMLKGAVAASADMAIPESASGEHELTFGVSGSIQVLGL
jgi:predicted secreted protein